MNGSALFERLIGYTLVEHSKTLIIKRGPYGFEIPDTQNVRLVEVYARTSISNGFDYKKFFGSTDWIHVPTEQCVVHTHNEFSLISVPPSLFGTAYEELQITYTSGLSEYPKDALSAIDIIDKLYDTGKIDEWHLFLPDAVLDVVEKYRREDK